MIKKLISILIIIITHKFWLTFFPFPSNNLVMESKISIRHHNSLLIIYPINNTLIHFNFIIFLIILVFFLILNYNFNYNIVVKKYPKIELAFLLIFFIFLFIPMANINMNNISNKENRLLGTW